MYKPNDYLLHLTIKTIDILLYTNLWPNNDTQTFYECSHKHDAHIRLHIKYKEQETHIEPLNRLFRQNYKY